MTDLIILAEDDEAIAKPLQRALEREKYRVKVFADGREALQACLAEEAALILLDLGLPGLDGIEVCRRLRQEHVRTPIVMLTARTQEVDLVLGLDAGADDYVTKPFRTGELMARIRANLRRTPKAPQDLVSGEIRVNVAARQVYVSNEVVHITPTEYELLVLLMENMGQVMDRSEIMREIWNTEWYNNTKTLDMHISTLRRKLGNSSVQLATVRGVGFRFDEADELV